MFGFVYCITNNSNGKKYIGKKQLWKTIKRPPLKGKKRNRISVVPSDYDSYWGSSNELLSDIEKLGISNFSREVLQVVSCKWDLAYWELWWQMKENVIFDEKYYNGILNVRLRKRK
jgi:hypothetical protein